MRKIFLLGVAFILNTNTVNAEQLLIRSGEHNGFSRIVIPYPRNTSWEITNSEEIMTLRTQASNFTYDFRDVFRFIPRDRITSIIPGDDIRTIVIKTAPQTRSKAYQLASGPVVIDVLDDLTIGPRIDPQKFENTTTTQYFEFSWKENLSNNISPTVPEDTSPARKITRTTNDVRVSTAEQQLLNSLSRAASQGIFNVDPTRKLKRVTPEPPSPMAHIDSNTSNPVPLQSETVFERDMGTLNEHANIMPNGKSCLDDQSFSVENWISNEPPIEQLTRARNNLIGEFDRPDLASIERLIRLYVAMGFGAEAKATIEAFNFEPASSDPLSYMADIIDGTSVPEDSPISYMAACSGKVSLWAFMGGKLPTSPDQINVNAIQSSFSALPPQIRDILGPTLIDKLLTLGHSDTAEAIRNALRRSSVEGSSPLALAQAQLDLASGHPLAAEKSLSEATSRNDLASAQSLVLFVEARLMRGQGIDNDTTADLAAQLHQNGPSDLGFRLRRALILAHGSVGNFDEAFNTLAEWPFPDKSDLQAKSLAELVDQLSRVPDDMIFAKQIFKQSSTLQQANLLPPLRITLANRLSKLGFSAAADDILTPAMRGTVSGRLALARSALAEKDGAAALAHLSGLDGDIATQLRADAYLALGEHANAAQILRTLGDDQAAAREAWRGASWEIVREHGSDDERAAIESQVDIPATQASDGPAPGPITRANSLISQSQDERALLQRLLNSY